MRCIARHIVWCVGINKHRVSLFQWEIIKFMELSVFPIRDSVAILMQIFKTQFKLSFSCKFCFLYYFNKFPVNGRILKTGMFYIICSLWRIETNKLRIMPFSPDRCKFRVIVIWFRNIGNHKLFAPFGFAFFIINKFSFFASRRTAIWTGIIGSTKSFKISFIFETTINDSHCPARILYMVNWFINSRI